MSLFHATYLWFHFQKEMQFCRNYSSYNWFKATAVHVWGTRGFVTVLSAKMEGASEKVCEPLPHSDITLLSSIVFHVWKGFNLAQNIVFYHALVVSPVSWWHVWKQHFVQKRKTRRRANSSLLECRMIAGCLSPRKQSLFITVEHRLYTATVGLQRLVI